MPTKRGPLMKTLKRFVADFPPENFAPWKKPNHSLQQVIDKNCKGKLEDTLQEVQEGLLFKHLEKLARQAR